jgi:hypothetical protein
MMVASIDIVTNLPHISTIGRVRCTMLWCEKNPAD